MRLNVRGKLENSTKNSRYVAVPTSFRQNVIPTPPQKENTQKELGREKEAKEVREFKMLEVRCTRHLPRRNLILTPSRGKRRKELERRKKDKEAEEAAKKAETPKEEASNPTKSATAAPFQTRGIPIPSPTTQESPSPTSSPTKMRWGPRRLDPDNATLSAFPSYFDELPGG
jgi:hypothetical protein